MSRYGDEKKKIFDFFKEESMKLKEFRGELVNIYKGSLITFVLLIFSPFILEWIGAVFIITLIILIGVQKFFFKEKFRYISFGIMLLLSFGIIILMVLESYQTIFYIVFIPLFILLNSFFGVLLFSFKEKHHYILIGMNTAIFGPALLIIKTNGEQLVDLYTEQPEKKRAHFLFGFCLSIGLTILYTPFIFFGVFMGNFSLWPLTLIIIIVLNIFFGMIIFFFKRKLWYISIGMIPLLFMIIPIKKLLRPSRREKNER